MPEKKVDKVLIPYYGDYLPKKAEEKALDRLKKGGELFLLHIIDDAPTRILRYQTGQIGEDSETIKNFEETMEDVQEKEAREYVEEVKKRAAKQGISVTPLYVSGSPGSETIRAVEENSIQLVVIEKLRDRLTEIFVGNDLDYIRREVSCEVQTV